MRHKEANPLSTPEGASAATIEELVRAALSQKELPFWILEDGDYMKGGKLNPDAVDATRVRRKGRHYTLQTGGAEFPDPFDPENLLFAEKQQLEELLQRLEAAAVLAKKEGKLVMLVIGNGGTILMLNIDGEDVPSISAKDLVDMSGDVVRKKFVVEAFDLTSIDSCKYQWLFTGDATIIISYIIANGSPELLRLLCIALANGTDTGGEGASNQKMQLGADFPLKAGMVTANNTSEKDIFDGIVGFTSTAEILAYMHKKKKQGAFLHSGGNNLGPMNPLYVRKGDDGHVNIFESPYGPMYADQGRLLEGGFQDHFARQYRRSLGGKSASYCPVILDGPNIGRCMGVDTGNPAIVLKTRVGEGAIETLIRVKVAKLFGKRWSMLITNPGFTANPPHLRVLKAEIADKTMNVIATSALAHGKVKHKYPTAEYIRKELRAVIVSMSEHAIMLKLMLAQMIWPDDIERQKIFLSEYNYCGEQPLRKGKPYRNLGTPIELRRRKFVNS